MKKLSFLFSIISFLSFAQKPSLQKQIENYLHSKNAKVGFYAHGIKSKEVFSMYSNDHFPMQSVYKLHLALAVLKEVDNGKFKLDQKILVKKTDLLAQTWSPIRDKYPDGNVNLTLAEIIQFTVSQSDNNGCDLLFRLIGSPKVVENHIKSFGIEDISIKTTEGEMHKDWDVQFTNWTTPKAASDLLLKLYEKKLLKKETQDFIWKTMVETTTGPKKIKGNLPKNTIVAHKTGMSDMKNGIRAASNDIGIIKMPNGNDFIVAAFVSNSKEKEEVNEKIIADLTKMAFDYFGKK